MSDGTSGDGGAGGTGGGSAGLGGEGGAGNIDPLTGKPVEAADGGAGGESGDQGAGADDGGVDPDWYENISADPGENESPSLRDWLKAKGVKDVNGLTKIARDTERALRESGRVKIPSEGASDVEIAEFRKAIGVPDDVSGYATPELKDADGNPVELNSDLLARLAGVAHAQGLPKAGYEALVADFIDAQQADIDAQTQAIQADTDATLKTWGKDQAENLAAGHRAIRALGLTVEDVQGLKVAWGSEKALNKLAELGKGMSEDSMIMGSPSRFGISGSEAQAALNSARQNPEWVAKAMTKGTPENAQHERWTDAIAAEAVHKQKAA